MTCNPDRPVDSSVLYQDDVAALRAVVAGTARDTGEDFFRSLVRNLAQAIDVEFAFVAEFCETKTRVRTRAYWAVNQFAENIAFNLEGTPCNDVIHGGLCHHPHGVKATFPDDGGLAALGIESYLGVPLVDETGEVLGHLAVFDRRPMPPEPKRLYIFKIFAERAAGELKRLQIEHALRDSEKRFRDLFEEAPIAYVFEDTDTRFVKVNRAGMELLGLKPEDVPGTIGYTLVAPDQGTQARIRETFADIQQGKQRLLPELELRRKDNGQPIWVQFWSRPEPDGKLTRTMIIDITARVLAEREKARLQRENAYLQEEIQASRNFEEIIGRSPALKGVLDLVRAVAPTDASVLIQGETGTGKELIARAIHSISRRTDKPLIKVNCAALPASLVESELFGHEKGAFTGANARRIGRFELADGGTIFLDEIGELPIEMQAKLLRVLQEGELDRIGGSAPVKVNVRVIAATNRNLSEAVANKEFREDLFYRLNVFPIDLPPLRERVEDIPLLAQYFTNRFAAQLAKRIDCIAAETMERLTLYQWPGNIRELENVIERAVILCQEDSLQIEPTSLALAGDSGAETQAGSLESVERNHIIAMLEQSKWRIEGTAGAAERLGLHPNTLRSRMKKMGICRPS